MLVFAGCSGAPRPQNDKTAVNVPIPKPTGLIFQSQISGTILGYDLKRPAGLAVSPRGELYIADTGNDRVIKMDEEMQPIRDLGGFGAGYGRFQGPEDLILDHGLSLFVLDVGNRRVVHLDAGLNFIEAIIPEEAPNEIVSTLGRLSGLAVSSFGEITVADYDDSRLIRLDNVRHFSRYIGDFGYGEGALMNPLGVALDRDGRMLVADGGNGRIAVYDDYGNYLKAIGRGTLEHPTAVTVAPGGIIWVADQAKASLYAFSPDGTLVLQSAGGEDEVGTMSQVGALAVSSDNILYVADSGHNRIISFQIVYEGRP